MTYFHNRVVITLSATMLVGLGITATPATAQTPATQEAVNKAHAYLSTAARGQDILSFVHFGQAYHGHTYTETRNITANGQQVPGHFGLIYQYKWGDGGLTNVAFLCDATGRVYEVQTTWTNAILNQPFVTANLTIQVLGNVIIQALGDNMTAADRQTLQTLVNNADAKGLLELTMKLQQ